MNGTVAEKRYTGTGFVLRQGGQESSPTGTLHLPWESDANLTAFGGRGLQPEFTRFVAYVPGKVEALAG